MTSTSEPKSFRPTREATRRDVLIAAGAGGAVAAGAPFWFKFAHAQEPIRIGFSMALSGGLAGAGKPALITMEIWREDINAGGDCSAGRSSLSTTTRPRPQTFRRSTLSC